MEMASFFFYIFAYILDFYTDTIKTFFFNDSIHFKSLNGCIWYHEVYAIQAISETANTTFEAHSDSNILIQMDFTPTKELMHEGVACEIINRTQKL